MKIIIKITVKIIVTIEIITAHSLRLHLLHRRLRLRRFMLCLLFCLTIAASDQYSSEIAEALTILPYFTPAAIPGLFVGCLLSNILGGAAIWDIIFGSIATLIGAIGTYVLRKNKWLAPLPPIIANTVIVPFVLKYAYGSEGIFAMFFVTIGASEFIVCGIIGMLLLFALNPVRNVIFKGVE